MDRCLRQIRVAELEMLRDRFTSGARVLEIGGGNGFQAQIIESFGCEVTSIDIPTRRRSAEQFFPVADYDGKTLPFERNTFDIVFSSNVLEHIAWQPQILREIRRVLRGSGIAIHLVPSASWRFWTSLSHYGAGLRFLLTRNGSNRSIDNRKRRRTSISWRDVLFAPVHGEYSNQLVEFDAYRRRRWQALFEDNGFVVDAAVGNGIYYSGAMLLSALGIDRRRRLARWLGSSCHAFTMRSN